MPVIPSPGYRGSVFINCPFDAHYRPFFDAVVFAVHDCGFVARCALERNNGGEVRVQKILDIIERCQFGIHDISRTELDRVSRLPRFNMPLELGFFLGAQRFGTGRQREKVCLVLDKARFRFQKFCSDIAGQDPESHGGKPIRAIRIVRDWLQSHATAAVRMPSGSIIGRRYQHFRRQLPKMCQTAKLTPVELTFNDFTFLIAEWLKVNAIEETAW